MWDVSPDSVHSSILSPPRFRSQSRSISPKRSNAPGITTSSFLSAGIAAALAREDRIQAKAALFPTVNALTQYIYTQGNGTPSGVFISNDGVHVYNEQAVVHAELFSFEKRALYQRSIAAEAAAKAKQDIAIRGLVGTVVQSYYALVSAQRHTVNAQRGVDEATRFLEITQKQERAAKSPAPTSSRPSSNFNSASAICSMRRQIGRKRGLGGRDRISKSRPGL
jgi:hypothetical protein